MTIDTNFPMLGRPDLQKDRLSLSFGFRHPHPLTQSRSRPIPNSYWATPLLLACEYPYAPRLKSQKLDAILLAGVRTFIDLTELGELSPYAPHLDKRAARLGIDVSTIEYHCFPIQDRSLPQSVEYMCKILDVLRDNERRGRISAVHCRGGIGRTGMVIGCWLVECGVAIDGEEALAVIAKMWKTVEKCKRFPHSPETGPQFEFVKNFRRVRAQCDAVLSSANKGAERRDVLLLRDIWMLATFSGIFFLVIWGTLQWFVLVASLSTKILIAPFSRFKSRQNVF